MQLAEGDRAIDQSIKILQRLLLKNGISLSKKDMIQCFRMDNLSDE